MWSYRRLLDRLPNPPWLTKHNPPLLERSLAHQIWWQFHHLPDLAKRLGCHILFSTDAASFARFRPSVVMSQDMLSYEPGIMADFGLSLDRLRLLAILHAQNCALRAADGVIFLTRYAARIIAGSAGRLNRTTVIHHGIGNTFSECGSRRNPDSAMKTPVRILYVSNAAVYKNQSIAVRAIARLRNRGHDLNLTLVGGGEGDYQKRLASEIASIDPDGRFVTTHPFVPHQELVRFYSDSDMFLFASRCECLPITLLEAMATGIPIVCSNRGPMPEVLQDGGLYFDPDEPESIADAVERMIRQQDLRKRLARRAKQISEGFSWEKCCAQTWSFLSDVASRHKPAHPPRGHSILQGL